MSKGFDITQMDKQMMRDHLAGVREGAARVRRAMKDNDARGFHEAVFELEKDVAAVKLLASFTNKPTY